jgi:hypothetical protein
MKAIQKKLIIGSPEHGYIMISYKKSVIDMPKHIIERDIDKLIEMANKKGLPATFINRQNQLKAVGVSFVELKE